MTEHSQQTEFSRPTAPPYAPLARLLAQCANWPPDTERLNALAAARGICNRAGQPIRFVAAHARLSALDYERQIATTGLVPTREAALHDVFNAFVWLAFPQLKAALNGLHEQAHGDRRTPQRDFATLLDESGILIAHRDPTLIDLLRQRAWQELFCEHRRAVERDLKFFVVGHAIYQKALHPYPGITAHALPLAMPSSFFDLPLDDAVIAMDHAAASMVSVNAAGLEPKWLTPLPIYAIPGWHSDQTAEFYADTRYFRPLRDSGRS